MNTFRSSNTMSSGDKTISTGDSALNRVNLGPSPSSTSAFDILNSFDVLLHDNDVISPLLQDDALPPWTFHTLVSHAGPGGDRSTGLEALTVEQLQVYLEPILQGLREIDAEDLLSLVQVKSNGATLSDCLEVHPIHDLIQPPTTPEQGNIVRYLHLNEVPGQYSMGIFIFPPHAKIPLHDHPGMCVLTRVLYGDLHRLSLDLPHESGDGTKQQTESSLHWRWNNPWSSSKKNIKFNSLLPQGAKRAFVKEIDYLQAPAVTCLYPFEGNLHEFVAGPHGAAVIDVLLPPYNAEEGRDCTFYEIQETSHTADNDGRKPCWIVPTGQPEDFHCISGKYKELGSH